MNPHLIVRRKAAHTLNALVKSFKFGAKGRLFDGEDHTQWIVHGDRTVIATRYGREIATVEILEGSQRHLTLPRWDGLIRTAHLPDFDPAHYGLVENTARDVLFGEKLPDSKGVVDFGEPPGLELPPQPRVKRTMYRQPRVIL